MVDGRYARRCEQPAHGRTFLLNKPYPTAPFSTLYLFGRGQDLGFQKAIDDSPRKRHHVRFWALSLECRGAPSRAGFWFNTDDRRLRPVLWIGAATKDTGFSLTRLTLQITHATDSDTNAERNFIIAELKQCGVFRRPRLAILWDVRCVLEARQVELSVMPARRRYPSK